MTLDEFITKYNGKRVGTGQCVALVKQYEDEILGLTPQSVGNAHDYFDNFENQPFLYNNFNKYYLNEGLPKKGDIIVWNTNAGGGYGHIAIVIEANETNFKSFDQNWNTPLKCNIESHNYKNVSGYLRKKGIVPPEPTQDNKKRFKFFLFNRRKRM